MVRLRIRLASMVAALHYRCSRAPAQMICSKIPVDNRVSEWLRSIPVKYTGCGMAPHQCEVPSVHVLTHPEIIITRAVRSILGVVLAVLR